MGRLSRGRVQHSSIHADIRAHKSNDVGSRDRSVTPNADGLLGHAAASYVVQQSIESKSARQRRRLRAECLRGKLTTFDLTQDCGDVVHLSFDRRIFGWNTLP